MSLRDLAEKSKEAPSLLDRLRKWLVREGFTKCDDLQLRKAPALIRKYRGGDEIWMLEFSSTTLFVQLAEPNVQISDGSADIFLCCGGDFGGDSR